METKKIVTGYLPRKHQEFLHQRLKRFNVLVCHRRFGKTVFCLNEMIDQGLNCQKKSPQYAYIAPTYNQAKRVAWEMIKDFTKDIPNVTVNEADLRVDIHRPWMKDKIRFMLLSAEKPGNLRGIYLDGVILDEFAECDPIVWSQVVRPALSDRRGWAIFIGTPKGRNHFYDIFQASMKSEKWFNCVFKASETRVISLDELEGARLTMTEEEYNQEYECDFSAALVGAYYGKTMDKLEADGHIASVPHDPALPVDTFWDLGIGDTTCVWFLQQIGLEYHLIDYIEMSGQDLAYYVQELKAGDRSRYNYRDHVLPHDAKARELGTGKTRQETLRSLGLTTTILPKQSVEDGINAVRMLLPKCYFDRQKCERGLNALRNYEKEYDNKNKIFRNKPKHNWASNGSDAFRYLALGQRPETTRRRSEQLPTVTDSVYDIFEV